MAETKTSKVTEFLDEEVIEKAVQDFKNKLKKEGVQQCKQASALVKEHPMTAVGLGVLGGFLLACLLRK